MPFSDDMDLSEVNSTTSSLGELATGIQAMLEQLIAGSDTTPEGAYIIEKERMADVFHAFTDLFDAIDAREEGTSPPLDSSNASIKQVFDRLGAIEKQVQRIQHAAPKTLRQPSWADIASKPPPKPTTTPRGRAVTVRPLNDSYKDKEPQEILKDLKKEIPGVMGIRPLRSGDIRVVLRDTKAKEQAMGIGKVGEARILRQDYPVEVAGVPLTIPVAHGGEGSIKNAPLVQEILKNNKHIQGNLITRVAWIHGARSQTAGKQRSSLIVYLATEETRDRVVKEGLTIKGIWHHVKLWAQALHSPRCFRCNRWGHTQTACASQARCGHCAGPHNTKDCTQSKKSSCVNCGRRHKAWNRRDCPIYKVVREEAARLRFSLTLETMRIQGEHNQRNTEQNQQQQPPRANSAAPAKRPTVGRPTGISKAGAAAGQQPLPWQATVRVEDTMEE
jgi:hypothetical protein